MRPFTSFVYCMFCLYVLNKCVIVLFYFYVTPTVSNIFNFDMYVRTLPFWIVDTLYCKYYVLVFNFVNIFRSKSFC